MPPRQFGCVLAGAIIATSLTTRAFSADAVVVATSGAFALEVSGIAGRMQLKMYFPQPSVGSTGITSDGIKLYDLSHPGGSSTTSQIAQNVLASGNSIAAINVNLYLDDIAYSNGQLYGVVARSDALQIVQINPNGTTVNILTQTGSTYTGQWRLSGATAGAELFAFREGIFPQPSNTVKSYLINPVSGTSSAFAITSTAGSSAFQGTINDTILNKTGTIVTMEPNAQFTGQTTPQTQLRISDGVLVGSLNKPAAYGSGSLGSPTPGSAFATDEFTYDFNSSANAVVMTGLSAGGTSWGKLYRNPITWTGSATASITNGAAPDNTVLTNVFSANPFQATAGIVTQSVTPAATGNFSARPLATGTFSMDLQNAARGVYTVNANGPIQATYSHDGIDENGRSLNFASWGTRSFGYDPISSNIIGNGDIELSNLGWDDPSNSFGFSTVTAGGSSALWFTSSIAARQILELPTAPTDMLLSFDYRLDSFPGGKATIDITINGMTAAHLNLTSASATYSHYSGTITDPVFKNLTNADFRSIVTDVGGSAWVYMDNFSLVAVPEPASLLALLAPFPLLLRRKRR